MLHLFHARAPDSRLRLVRLSDVYLGEFMRLYSHHAFRGFLESHDESTLDASPSHLRLDDWWKDYFGDTARSRQRQLFAG